MITDPHSQLRLAIRQRENLLRASAPLAEQADTLERELVAIGTQLVALEEGRDADGCRCPRDVPAWRSLIATKRARRAELLAEIDRLRAAQLDAARQQPELATRIQHAAARVVAVQVATTTVPALRAACEEARRLAIEVAAAGDAIRAGYRVEDERTHELLRIGQELPSEIEMRAILARVTSVTNAEIATAAEVWARRAAELAAPEPQDTMREAAQ